MLAAWESTHDKSLDLLPQDPPKFDVLPLGETLRGLAMQKREARRGRVKAPGSKPCSKLLDGQEPIR